MNEKKIELSKKLTAKFHSVSEYQDELEFFMELQAEGITLEDIKIYCPDHYEYSKTFMEEHGLV